MATRIERAQALSEQASAAATVWAALPRDGTPVVLSSVEPAAVWAMIVAGQVEPVLCADGGGVMYRRASVFAPHPSGFGVEARAVNPEPPNTWNRYGQSEHDKWARARRAARKAAKAHLCGSVEAMRGAA